MNGGLSGMGATCLIQPIDMVKVRLQLGATGGPVSFTAQLHHRTSEVLLDVLRSLVFACRQGSCSGALKGEAHAAADELIGAA